jgi:TRAP-type C4-dicarboxylate transport system permease small subunit
VLFAAMALVSFCNILGRYVFHYSLAFTEEVTVNLFVWLTVVGCGIAFERGTHLGMVSLCARFPRAWRVRLVFAGAALSTALFAAIDILLVVTIVREISVFHALSPSLGIPVWLYYAGVVALSPFVFVGIVRGARRGAGV